jgi:hypothetical protein
VNELAQGVAKVLKQRVHDRSGMSNESTAGPSCTEGTPLATSRLS